LLELASIFKLKILHQHVFRNTNPAIFGVRVEAGKLVPGLNIIGENGERIGKIKNMQSENQPVKEASEGTELAISVSGTNFERKLKDKNFIYSELSSQQIKNFRKNKDLLSAKELLILQEIENLRKT